MDAVTLALPGWIDAAVPRAVTLPSPEERMRLAIRLAAANVEHGTGGPFGAAVFEQRSGRLVAVGVNVVLASRCSAAHAELLALALAQRALDTHDLGAPGLPDHQLVTSAEPCAMCFGGVLWSGVRSLLCAARGDDARAIGFDEGPLPERWEHELRRRGIEVVREVCRAEARDVLERYAREGVIYNPRRG